jgi:DNA primase
VTEPLHFARLTDEDRRRVRAEHSLVDVLARAGVQPPPGWDGASDFMISCPIPEHDDSTPSCIVHPQTDRWNCFGCGKHGDVMQLVMEIEHISSVAMAAAILDHGRALHPARVSRRQGEPTARHGVTLASAERPHLDRTSIDRIYAVNDAAWRYLTTPTLAARARAYLARRGIDVRALEGEAGRPLAGHTPYSGTGLVEHLRACGYADDELVDAGWASRRPDSRMTDRYRRRILLPAYDQGGPVIGVYGRDVTNRASAKYLNTPDTAVFSKGAAIYRPAVLPVQGRTSVIVCEGSLDALAIAAHAATVGRTAYFAPVSPSGTALTMTQAKVLLRLSASPPVVCADSDAAGIAASMRWAAILIHLGRETFTTTLPDEHDPASWLCSHGPAGLVAFINPTSLSTPDRPRPASAGGLIARNLMAEATAGDPSRTRHVVADVADRLGALAGQLGPSDAVKRYVHAAAAALLEFDVGTEVALRRLIHTAVASTRQGKGGDPWALDHPVTSTPPRLHI